MTRLLSDPAKRNDLPAVFVEFVKNSIGGRNEFLKGPRRENNFAMPAFRDQINKFAAKLQFRRPFCKITFVHSEPLSSLLTPERFGMGRISARNGNFILRLIVLVLPTALFGRPTAESFRECAA